VCGRLAPPRAVRRVTLRDVAGPFDEGLLTWFPGPRSYTGEDVAEVSCHGNPLIVARLLDAFVAAGARVAHPGEFTRRAFLNGKVDLTRAEAVLQAISATSPGGLALAHAGLSGAVAGLADALRDALVDVAAELEAILDYPGEDLLVAPDEDLVARLRDAADRARAATRGAGHLAVDGARVAIVGPPNVGKSSLFNALLGRPRALVSPTPGTTRDVVESALQLGAVRVTLLDTAGQRDAADPVEAAGVELAREASAGADLVLDVVRVDRPGDGPCRGLRVGTHLDLGGAREVDVAVSCVTGDGIDTLKAAILAGLRGEEPGGLVASLRQRDLLLAVAAHAEGAAAELAPAGPAVAVERVYAALAELDALVGRDTREAVLDRLFARFCIGK
jgi:tRNA modification GTPase